MLGLSIKKKVPEISTRDLYEALLKKSEKPLLIDVRRAEEFNGELGHIEGAILKTLGPSLNDCLNKLEKEKEIIFICRSGGRSQVATELSLNLGFLKTRNMKGGMLNWNQQNFPVLHEEKQKG